MKVIHQLLALIILTTSSVSHAMTCSQFNALGPEPGAGYKVTAAQATEFKKVIATYAASLSRFSTRGRAFSRIRENGKLPKLMVETMAATKMYCEAKQNEPMKRVAIEEFDSFLDAVAKIK